MRDLLALMTVAVIWATIAIEHLRALAPLGEWVFNAVHLIFHCISHFIQQTINGMGHQACHPLNQTATG
jgi:hypothetical protein